ncbi:hypothetical protein C6A85_000000112655 [Mycobacterium sp. ITM-2017-0098]|nr:hypothetical protein C6A85_000000112655 [Mycobacterium sp. ITM-2017-0098]
MMKMKMIKTFVVGAAAALSFASVSALCAGTANATSFEEMVCAMALQPRYEYYGASGSKYISLSLLFQDLGISELAPGSEYEKFVVREAANHAMYDDPVERCVYEIHEANY